MLSVQGPCLMKPCLSRSRAGLSSMTTLGSHYCIFREPLVCIANLSISMHKTSAYSEELRIQPLWVVIIISLINLTYFAFQATTVWPCWISKSVALFVLWKEIKWISRWLFICFVSGKFNVTQMEILFKWMLTPGASGKANSLVH